MTRPVVDSAAGTAAAIKARRARASIKRAVAEGRRSAVGVLETAQADEASWEHGLRVAELLGSIPGLGPVRSAGHLDRLEISPKKRLGGRGPHQVIRLRELLLTRAAFTPDVSDGCLLVLAGPTAVGKGTVSTWIRENHPEVELSVSATTRAPRPGEIEGVNYYFVSDEEFDRMVRDGEFLEWAVVHNQSRYGTPRPPIDRALDAGKSVLLEIDIQGARQVKAAMPSARGVFLLPPSWDELVRRLTGRGTESAEEQSRRLNTAVGELEAVDEFDFLVVNNSVERAGEEVVGLMRRRSA